MNRTLNGRLLVVLMAALIAGTVCGCTTRELLFGTAGTGLVGAIIYREHDNRSIGTHPDPPSIIAVTSPSSTSLQVRWQENQNPDFASYKLYRDTSSTVSSSTGTLAATITDRSQTQYLDENLAEYTHYYYALYVCNVSGSMIASNVTGHVTGDIDNRLNSGNTLITDSRNGKVVEVDSSGATIWECTGLSGPYAARRLQNGNTLVCEADYHATGNGSVKEFNPSKTVVWQVASLTKPTSAIRLDGGNTLITESAASPNGRVFEVDQDGSVVWSKTGLDEPMEAVRLANGNTLVALYGSNKVVEYDPSGRTVWSVVGISAPTDVRRSDSGTTWISAGGEGRVIEVNTSGDIINAITGLAFPRSVELLSGGNVLVSDGRDTVWEFKPIGEATWWYHTNLDVPTDADHL